MQKEISIAEKTNALIGGGLLTEREVWFLLLTLMEAELADDCGTSIWSNFSDIRHRMDSEVRRAVEVGIRDGAVGRISANSATDWRLDTCKHKLGLL